MWLINYITQGQGGDYSKRVQYVLGINEYTYTCTHTPQRRKTGWRSFSRSLQCMQHLIPTSSPTKWTEWGGSVKQQDRTTGGSGQIMCISLYPIRKAQSPWISTSLTMQTSIDSSGSPHLSSLVKLMVYDISSQSAPHYSTHVVVMSCVLSSISYGIVWHCWLWPAYVQWGVDCIHCQQWQH